MSNQYSKVVCFHCSEHGQRQLKVQRDTANRNAFSGIRLKSFNKMYTAQMSIRLSLAAGNLWKTSRAQYGGHFPAFSPSTVFMQPPSDKVYNTEPLTIPSDKWHLAAQVEKTLVVVVQICIPITYEHCPKMTVIANKAVVWNVKK